MWFEILSVFILFKFKKRPNISGIRVVFIGPQLTSTNNKQLYFLTNVNKDTVADVLLITSLCYLYGGPVVYITTKSPQHNGNKQHHNENELQHNRNKSQQNRNKSQHNRNKSQHNRNKSQRNKISTTQWKQAATQQN